MTQPTPDPLFRLVAGSDAPQRPPPAPVLRPRPDAEAAMMAPPPFMLPPPAPKLGPRPDTEAFALLPPAFALPPPSNACAEPEVEPFSLAAPVAFPPLPPSDAPPSRMGHPSQVNSTGSVASVLSGRAWCPVSEDDEPVEGCPF